MDLSTIHMHGFLNAACRNVSKRRTPTIPLSLWDKMGTSASNHEDYGRLFLVNGSESLHVFGNALQNRDLTGTIGAE